MSTTNLTVRLTPRDDEILDVLQKRCRVLTTNQLARVFWPGQQNSLRSARARLRELEQAGLLAISRVLARKELSLTSPLASWRPGEPVPEFGRISWAARKRWKAQKTIPGDLVHLPNRRPRVSEVSHDISLAGVFLWYRDNRPKLASVWVLEDTLREELHGEMNRGEIPDAVIRENVNGTPTLVVELAGSYRTEKLERFHEAHLASPYVIW